MFINSLILKKLLHLIFFILASSLSTLKAQNRHTIDSLQNELQQFESHKNEMGSNATPLMDSVKADILYHLALQYWGNVSDTGIYYASRALELSQHIGYEKGIGNAYNVMGLCNMAMKNGLVALGFYQKALAIRAEIGDKTGMAWTYNDMGILYGNMGETEESIKSHLNSLKIKEETGDRSGIAASYGKIGHDYFAMGKFPEAVNNYLNALKIGEEDNDKLQICGFYDDIGNVYYTEGNYPEALKNYRNGLKMATETGDKFQVAFADVNMGRICYKQGNDTGALRFMLAGLKIFEEVRDYGSVADIHYYLGLVHSAMKNYTLALTYADSSLQESHLMGSQYSIARGYIEVGSMYEKLGRLQQALDTVTKGLLLAKKVRAKLEMQNAYSSLVEINAEMQNYRGAYEAEKEYMLNLDSINSSESVKKIATLEMNYAFEKKEDSIKAEQEKNNIIKTAESNRKTIITLSAIVISILTVLMAILLIRGLQIKRKKDKIIFEKENNLLLLEKQRMEDELAKAKLILDDYIVTMIEKNALLEQFKVDVENLKTLKAKEIDENRIAQLEHLNKTTILTDEDWSKFKELFEQVYKGFFIRLKEKRPELTQAEIRLLCLTKLKLDTKQMGGILGVSYDTIKKSRHRLRKKLGLSEENTIEEIVDTI